MASQRHKVWEQGASAAGEVHAQGVVAPGIHMQVDPEEIGVLKGGPPMYNNGLELREGPDPLAGITVPTGAPGGPLQGSTLTGALPEERVPPDTGVPTISSLNPSSTPVNTPVQITITGTGFNESSTVSANGNGLVSAYVSETEMTADLPSFPDPQELGINVTTEGEISDSAMFSITAAGAGTRTIPSGPFNIVRIDNADDGMFFVMDGGEFKAGDRVLVEATGNTDVNGEWTVLLVDDAAIILDNNFELTTVIEARGRVTIIAEA